VLVADLSTNAGIEAVEQRIAAVGNLDVLVNNAGGGGAHENFQDVTLESQLGMLTLQAVAPVRLVKAALPSMINRERGVIINVASVDAFILRKGHVMYSATKAFLRTFSESLAMDLQGTRIRVQALCPGAVNTEIWKKRPNFPEEMWVPKEQLVAASLDAFQKKMVTVMISDNLIMEAVKGVLKDQLRNLERTSKNK
jgi:short-subunit dehydrogenase